MKAVMMLGTVKLRAGTEVECPVIDHIGVILDGNRRWAKKHGVHPSVAYRQGARRVVELMAACAQREISFVTLWALSRDNLQRPKAEIEPLLDVIINGLVEVSHTGRWRIRPIGDIDLLPRDAVDRLGAIEALTSNAGVGTFNVAVAYGGRVDIVSAVRRLLERDPGALGASTNTDTLVELLSSNLQTGGQPDPDLVIRTSGELRMSGFMPWQTAYSELYFTDVDWPDFTDAELDKALNSYRRRDRRWGA